MTENNSALSFAEHSRAQLTTASGTKYDYYRLESLVEAGLLASIDRLPFTVRILLENLLRHAGGEFVTQEQVEALAGWQPVSDPSNDSELPFLPARVILQDFTGVPCVVDLATMRSAMDKLGGDVTRINPLVPVDLVIDHSVQVDHFGTLSSFKFNVEREYQRNSERYELLRWGQRAFQNFRVVPPGTGIVHQVNLEYLAPVVMVMPDGAGTNVAYPDTLVGTDSHTTMVNSLGVLGYGVGGIEAEAVMLGQPLYQLMPEVVGVKFTGSMRPGTTATDLVLSVTELLRKHGVVGRFVEYCGTGLSNLALADRATIANMSPEYGATAGLFPIDDETLRYMRLTGRSDEQIDLVERYAKTQSLFRTDATPDPSFNELIELDLATIEPSMAGPRRPQDRISLGDVKSVFRESFDSIFTGQPNTHEFSGNGNGYDEQSIESFPASDPPAAMAGATHEGVIPGESKASAIARQNEAAALAARAQLHHVGDVNVHVEGVDTAMHHGSVVIAAITSCTNTSNPSVMLGAGLLAKNAVERGLSVHPSVKTSLAPGSQVVTRYLDESGVTPYLEALGFHVVGFGCTTCIGNSGPLPETVASAVDENELVVASVLSGNRNFEGRIHPQVRASFLASPPLVVAYALAGTVDINLATDPVGEDPNGDPVYLADIWPSEQDIRGAIAQSVNPEMFREEYRTVFAGDQRWQTLPIPEGALYKWNPESTYVREPPFFEGLTSEPGPVEDISNARVLALLGDSVTTDHISPAGSIAKSSPAGQYLENYDVAQRDFNSYGSRRGNHEVMIRGTFANIRLRNAIADGREGNWTTYFPTGELMSIYDASMYYQEAGVPLVVIAGKEYGTGSSRDWAAKGTLLLGVKAVFAESFERIHRSNLVGMGVLPLQFKPGDSAASLGLTGTETFTIADLESRLTPRAELPVTVTRSDGSTFTFTVIARIDSHVDVRYYKNGGILPAVLRRLMQA